MAILDADKEGFLRSEQALIQTIGRAARHVDGTVIMYADMMTDSMRRAIDETNRRRAKQESYNKEHGIVPASIVKAVRDLTQRIAADIRQPPQRLAIAEGRPRVPRAADARCPRTKPTRLIKDLEKQMKAAAQPIWSSRKRPRCATRSSSCGTTLQAQDSRPIWEQLRDA